MFRLVSVAIDFGTSSSGYAFAFKEKGTDKFQSPVLNNWKMDSASSSTDKAPTCLLLKRDKTFHSFGYTAENKYSLLCDERKQKGWWYFEQFRMLLYQTKLSRDAAIKDAEGKSMAAHDVFVHVIAHLKKRILNEVRAQNSGIKDESRIQYVITVPAIRSDAAKQFMREAATDTRVGIKDEQLRLVLEPEAASVYCLYTLLDTIDQPVGHKYITADLGGGTVDIATHEVIEHARLLEIHVVRRDDLGGQMFNTQFLEFLDDMFGQELFSKWKRSESSDYLALLRTIEGLKWEITQSEKDVQLKIDDSLIDILDDDTDEGLYGLVSRSAFKTSVDLVENGKLSMGNGFIRDFFKKTLNAVEKHIRAITNEHSDIGTIFLVGGLAKSPYIRECIRTSFPDHRLIAPEDPGIAVLRGAILLGDKPQTIVGQLARYTYGVAIAPLFEEGVHREDYRVTRDGEDRCRHVFEKLIEKGQVIKYGQPFETKTFIIAKQPETKNITFHTTLYQSTQASPMYTKDEGCVELGKIIELPPEGRWPDYCKSTTQLIVGVADIKLRVKTLDKTYEQKIDRFKPPVVQMRYSTVHITLMIVSCLLSLLVFLAYLNICVSL